MWRRGRNARSRASVPADGEEEAVGRRMMTPRGGDGEGQDVAMAEG